MELFLSAAALCAFSLSPAGASVMLRCGLAACLRFSPRAALALSSIASLSCCTAMFFCRGGLRAIPNRQRAANAAAAFFGGTVGRMLLILFTARFSGSLALSRLQAIPLLLLSAVCMHPLCPFSQNSHSRLFWSSLFCAALDGFFGCGGTAFFLLFTQTGVRRKRLFLPGAALLNGIFAQCAALLFTFFSGAAQIFPGRMLFSLAAASALGGIIFEKTKKRGQAHRGLRIALSLYTLLAALAGIEQAFLN